MSDTSKTALYSLDESNWGVTPASALQTMRFTSMNFRPIISTTESQEIIDDAQLQDLIKTGEAAEGEVGFELSADTYDAWFASLFRCAWPSTVSVTGTTFACDTSDDGITDSGNGFVTAGFKAGQIIKVSGFTEAVNNGYHIVRTVAAGKITVATNLTTEVAGDSVTITGTPIYNYTTVTSHSIEQKWTNSAGTAHYIGYTGMRVAGARLSLAPGSVATGSFNFLGKQGTPSGSSIGTGAATAATTTSVMNCIGDIKLMQEAAAAITLTKLDIAIDAGLRSQYAIGTSGATGIGQGQFKITGSIQLYLEDRDLIQKAIDQTASELHVVIADAANNAYALSLPQIKYGQPDYAVGGNNQDLLLTLPFTAMKDATLLRTAFLTRIG